jgi:hypothetical protein
VSACAHNQPTTADPLPCPAPSQLSDFITQAVIPPQLVTNICAAEVNEAYIDYILELNSKVRFAKHESSQRTMAYRDIASDIEKLRARAAMRMRDFLLQKIGACDCSRVRAMRSRGRARCLRGRAWRADGLPINSRS